MKTIRDCYHLRSIFHLKCAIAKQWNKIGSYLVRICPCTIAFYLSDRYVYILNIYLIKRHIVIGALFGVTAPSSVQSLIDTSSRRSNRKTSNLVDLDYPALTCEFFWLQFVCCRHFNVSHFLFFSGITETISLKFGAKHSWEKGIQICSYEGSYFCPRIFYSENILSKFLYFFLKNNLDNFEET